MADYSSTKRKEYPMEKRQSLQQMVLGKLTARYRRMKLDHFLTPYPRIDSKWMKDLNVKQESIKILENAGSNLFNLGRSNFWLDMSPKTRETKAKMNYWDFTRIKSFCTAKETVDQKTTDRMGEDTCKCLVR